MYAEVTANKTSRRMGIQSDWKNKFQLKVVLAKEKRHQLKEKGSKTMSKNFTEWKQLKYLNMKSYRQYLGDASAKLATKQAEIGVLVTQFDVVVLISAN